MINTAENLQLAVKQVRFLLDEGNARILEGACQQLEQQVRARSSTTP